MEIIREVLLMRRIVLRRRSLPTGRLIKWVVELWKYGAVGFFIFKRNYYAKFY